MLCSQICVEANPETELRIDIKIDSNKSIDDFRSNHLPTTKQVLSRIDDRFEMAEKRILSLESRSNENAEFRENQTQTNGYCNGRIEEQVILIENVEM